MGVFIFFRLSISAFFAITVLFNHSFGRFRGYGYYLLNFSGPSLISFRFSNFKQKLVCEKIRFSSLFAAGARRNGKGSQVFYQGCQGLIKRWSHKQNFRRALRDLKHFSWGPRASKLVA